MNGSQASRALPHFHGTFPAKLGRHAGEGTRATPRSAVLFPSNSLSQNHLALPKNSQPAYNLCSRFHRLCVYSCASPDTA